MIELSAPTEKKIEEYSQGIDQTLFWLMKEGDGYYWKHGDRKVLLPNKVGSIKNIDVAFVSSRKEHYKAMFYHDGKYILCHGLTNAFVAPYLYTLDPIDDNFRIRVMEGYGGMFEDTLEGGASIESEEITINHFSGTSTIKLNILSCPVGESFSYRSIDYIVLSPDQILDLIET
jgi:hypothetical protein